MFQILFAMPDISYLIYVLLWMLDGFVVLGMLFRFADLMTSIRGCPRCLYDHIVHTED
jgi:hypothetical protein